MEDSVLFERFCIDCRQIDGDVLFFDATVFDTLDEGILCRYLQASSLPNHLNVVEILVSASNVSHHAVHYDRDPMLLVKDQTAIDNLDVPKMFLLTALSASTTSGVVRGALHALW